MSCLPRQSAFGLPAGFAMTVYTLTIVQGAPRHAENIAKAAAGASSTSCRLSTVEPAPVAELAKLSPMVRRACLRHDLNVPQRQEATDGWHQRDPELNLS